MSRSADLLLAAERAIDVGGAILSQGRSHVGALIPKGDRDFASSVDLAIERAVKRELAHLAPGVAFLGEEGDEVDIHTDRYWALDPVDGTVNFTKGSPLCAISLALVEAGRSRIAVVDVPLLGEHYVAVQGAGAYLNGRRLRVAAAEALEQALVGLTDFAVGGGAVIENEIHRRLMGKLVPRSLRVRVHGSAALDLAWLAAGRLNATVMLSNLAWDVQGGALLVREAGGRVFDVDGSEHTTRSRFTLAAAPPIEPHLIDLVAASVHETERELA
jgi:myo-inositol-1(or 4)-monophosphatase